jgi:hypothetical protein
MNARPNKVYFIRAGDHGPVKIGTAHNIAVRMNNLQNGHYEQLNLIRVVDGDRHLEMRIHERFRHLRIRREWFQFDAAMLTEDLGGLVGSVIDRLIQRYGSQSAMSRATGFSPLTISKWRNGDRPSIKNAQRLVDLVAAQ